MVCVVVTDADVLFGGTTRALFIFLDYVGALRVHWSPRILGEMSAALVKHGRKPDVDAALEHERLMNASLENALVSQELVDRHEAALQAYVTDPRDAHVAACAYELRTGGYYPDLPMLVLSTRNLADYKVRELTRLGIIVQHPDSFLTGLPLLDVARAFKAWRETLPAALDTERLLGRLAKDGNPGIAEALWAGSANGEIVL